MPKINLFKLFALLAAFSLVLTACGSRGGEPGDGEEAASGGFACPEPENRMEVVSRDLNIFVMPGSVPQDMIECFELVYGVRVNLDEYSSNEEMYARVSAGGLHLDLVQPAGYIVPLMIRQGLIQELDHSKLPVMANFDKNYLDLGFDPGNRYTIPYQAGSYAIIVNTGTLQSLPRTWSDLWKGEYAHRMVMPDDGRVVIGMALLTLGRGVNATDPVLLREAQDKLWELTPNIQVFDNNPGASLIAGDVDLGIARSSDALLLQKENPAFQYIYPLEGAILWQDNWAMLADASHADAAYAWLNYTMQGNIFWMMLRDFPNANPNAAALEYARTNKTELYAAYVSSPITNTPPEAVANGHRIEDVGDATPLYDNIWVEVKGN